MQLEAGCVVLLFCLTNAFNLAPKYATVIADPQGQVDSYFGYSVNLLTRFGSMAWVIVGAPRANSSTHMDLIEPGVAYLCSLLKQGQCNPITLDTTGNTYHPHINDLSYKHRKDNAWIGGAIDVLMEGDGRGRILVCGPRWSDQHHDEFYLMNGICYLKTFPFDSAANATMLMPLIGGNQGYQLKNVTTNTTEDIFFYAYGEAGMSVHFTNFQQKREILIGAPGVKQWAGTVIRYNDAVDDYDYVDDGSDVGKHIVPNPVETPKLTDFGYFGYSTDSGQFFKGKLHYVGGAPRAGSLKGKVFVYDFPKKNDEEYKILIELEGYQMGEYFGASVCVVDLNDDKMDDLAVGAPYHSLDTQGSARLTGDEGRVYIFINEGSGILREIGDKNLIMGGQVHGAQFGTTIAKIGDINKDGYNDIAVGAPYEDSGRGAIYIYHGRSSGIHHKYSQRITAREIHSSLTGFGISISRGVDIDGNHYNDLAIGAFTSGHAVIIPSQPVISFRGRIYGDVEKIETNSTGFIAFACLFYSGYYAPDNVVAKITLTALSSESRAQFSVKGGGGRTSNTHSYYTSLNNQMEKCDSIRVELTKEENQDFSKPIELQMQYTLDMQGAPQLRKKRDTVLRPVAFCKICPVVDPNQISSVSRKLPYAIECGEDNICRTDLTVAANFENIEPPFVLGSRPKLTVRVVVTNIGEQAFLVKLNVSIPSVTPLSRLPAMCHETAGDHDDDRTQLECDLTSNLATNSKKVFLLEVDMVGLSAKTGLLHFRFNVSSTGEEKTPENNINTISLPVQTVADVTIQGKSNQDSGIHAKGNQTFYHTFEIANNGPSPLSILRLEFKIPVSMTSIQGDITFARVYRPSAYFDNQPLTCTTLRGNFASDVDQSGGVRLDLDYLDDDQSITKRSINDSVEQGSIFSQQSVTSQLPINRTMFVNCSSPAASCLMVQCDAGPFVTQQNRAVVSFRITANFDDIEPFLGKKDIVVITSVGTVEIKNLPNALQPPNGKPDIVAVTSIFYGNLPDQTVASWVLPVSIAVGILILLFIVGGLIKMGFFRRKKKDDLNERLEDDTGASGDNENDDINKISM